MSEWRAEHTFWDDPPRPRARPTIYRGLQMRSRLEAKVARQFDEWGAVWHYEPWALDDGKRQYLPDFLVQNIYFRGNEQTASAIIEVRGTWERVEENMHREGAIVHACYPGVPFIYVGWSLLNPMMGVCVTTCIAGTIALFASPDCGNHPMRAASGDEALQMALKATQ